MPPLAEVGRALCAESDGACVDECYHSQGLGWRHRLFRVPAWKAKVQCSTGPQAQSMLDEPAARMVF